MVTLTLNKATDQIRRNNPQKRRAVEQIDTKGNRASQVTLLSEIASSSPSPDLLIAASDAFEHLLHSLNASGDTDLEKIAIASMEGYGPAEIAEQLHCATRTVQRKLSTIRGLWGQILE